MINSRCRFYIWVLSTLILIFSICGQSHQNVRPDDGKEKNHVAFFIFGDSLFDAGNNNYLKIAAGRANIWPYGMTFFKHPTGRFTDGRIIPDFLAEYAKLPFIKPYLEPDNHQYIDGVNFASGGAGALAETRPGLVIDLPTQLVYFKDVERQLRQKEGEAETQKLLLEALYLFSIGSNDYVVPYTTNSTVLHFYSKEEYVAMVIGNLTTLVKEIYHSGGRKFGFINMPPLARVPFTRALTHSTRSELTLLAKLHNKALPQVLKQLQGQLKGFKYSLFDSYSSLSARISNPSKYGFKEEKMACCGSGPYREISNCGVQGKYKLCENPSKYVFFDAGHPTEKIYNQFAKLMWNGDSDIVKPCNIKTLLE